MQLLDAIEPGKDCEFARQLVQLRLPIAVLYVFAWQIVQLPPSGPVNPCLHTQLLSSIEPWGDCEFGGQTVQLADPVTVLYVFDSQIVQLPPSGPVKSLIADASAQCYGAAGRL
jgi:hypothetical protein